MPEPVSMSQADPASIAGAPISLPEATSQNQVRSSSAAAGVSLFGVFLEIIQTLVLAALIFVLIRNVIQNYRIDGISMEPNFHNGQFLFVNRYAYCPGIHLEVPLTNIELYEKTWCLWRPKRGDVIIFEYPRDPSRDFIKRVIGLPGETVEVKAGKVYVNGKLVPEPFGPNPGSYTSGPVKVGPDEVYVMGDNRNNSSDSHMWGPLPQAYIIGKAWVSYWPPKYWAIVPHYDLTDLAAAAS
jgi:signal peptidase I